MGGVDYPFSFEINVEKKQWIFRYKKQTNAAEFDFEYPMDESAIRDMYAQIEKQYAEMEWSLLGKSHLYTFDLPQNEFEWCYSAKAFNAVSRVREPHNDVIHEKVAIECVAQIIYKCVA